MYELSEIYGLIDSEMAVALTASFALSVGVLMTALAKEVNGNPDVLMTIPKGVDMVAAQQSHYQQQTYFKKPRENTNTTTTSAGTSTTSATTTGYYSGSSACTSNNNRQNNRPMGGGSNWSHNNTSGAPGSYRSSNGKTHFVAAPAPTTASTQPEQSPMTKIRVLINKLTDKNFDEYSQRITKALTLYGITEEIGAEIFHMMSGNNFYVKNYAKLYTTLVEKFPLLRTITDQYVADFVEKINTAIYVADQTDYSAFCKMNEDMDRRRSTSMFFINLTNNGTVSHPVICHILTTLLQKIADGINQDASKLFMDELCEHVATFLDKDMMRFIRTGATSAQVTITFNDTPTLIFDFILYLSKTSIKTHRGLTSKSIFKFGDIATIVKM